MNFAQFFAYKIALDRQNKDNISRLIIFIGQCTVAIGLLVSILTISTGVGTKKAIKKRMADFNGHYIITDIFSEGAYNSTPFELEKDLFALEQNWLIDKVQPFATIGGIIRTETEFEGAVLKGYDNHHDKNKLRQFIVKGKLPDYSVKGYSIETAISEKLAHNLKLKVGDYYQMFFIKKDGKPLYRKFEVTGIYKTDIKNLDDLYIVCQLKQVQKLKNWEQNQIGGIEIFTHNLNRIKENQELIQEKVGYHLRVKNVLSQQSQVSDWIALFDNNIFIIITLMLIVVTINIIMVLLILIVNRTQSIGLLKTLGAKNRSIQKVFIYYGLFILLPGLFAGNAISLILLGIQKAFSPIKLNPETYYISKLPVWIDWEYFIAINLGYLVISVIVMVLPSLWIATISPTKALKFT